MAAAAGALLRFGLMYGLPHGALHENVRFAHTHLMYFGWVTPALFTLIGAYLTERTGRRLPRAFHLAITASLIAGLLSFAPFLLSGYRPTLVLGMSLPLSMIASSPAVLAWYLWGAAFSPVASGALMDALVHFYLDLFSNGWFALALLVGGPTSLHALARFFAAYGLLTLAIQLGLAAWRRRDQGRWRHGAIALLLGGKALAVAILWRGRDAPDGARRAPGPTET